jgi:hypothetical protein
VPGLSVRWTAIENNKTTIAKKREKKYDFFGNIGIGGGGAV